MLSQHYLTFPFYVPRICSLFRNWPLYMFNYLSRATRPAEYHLRSGHTLIDGAGTLAGTIAVVFVRREYGALQQMQTVVDIGANMGTFAVYAALCCPSARVYCYEPIRENFEVLARNIRINGLDERVTATQRAVASASGSRVMSLGSSPLHSLVRGPESAERQSVSCTTLSEIIENHKLHAIDLLKMNCEGAEYEILESCPAPELRRVIRIRLEYHNLESEQRNGDSLRRFLEARGFTIERFSRYRNESGFIWASRV